MKKATIKRVKEDQDYILYTQTNRRRRVTKKYVLAGSWSLKENEAYLNFLENHQFLFQSQYVRRSSRVFTKMSSLLRHRDSEQCRSHHQKLSIRFSGEISQIISYLRQKIKKENMKLATQQCKKSKVSFDQPEIKQKQLQKFKTGSSLIVQQNEHIVSSTSTNCFKITLNLNNIEIW